MLFALLNENVPFACIMSQTKYKHTNKGNCNELFKSRFLVLIDIRVALENGKVDWNVSTVPS